MEQLSAYRYLELSADIEAALIAGARDTSPVSGYTHDYYKYPARFSPHFVRSVVSAFTAEGDLCLDPHMGGGTTLVEAMALGRNAVGFDISSLAEFVSSTKTAVYSDDEIVVLDGWSCRIGSAINIHKPSQSSAEYRELGYYRHLDGSSRWRMRKAIDQALASADGLNSARTRAFARCVVLRAAQLLLDSRTRPPSVASFRKGLSETARRMLSGARDFKRTVARFPKQPTAHSFHRPAQGVELDGAVLALGVPKLVVTSPPYPGVHVLYHRWQVEGGKETPLPFMIAGRLDGSGLSHYTMGDRKRPGLSTYFENIRASVRSVARLCDDDTVIVQMLAFSEPEWQLEKYLEVMTEVGLEERFLASLANVKDGRLWRAVPNRKWYSSRRGKTPASSEVVLFHRKRPTTSRLGTIAEGSHLSARRLSGASSAATGI